MPVRTSIVIGAGNAGVIARLRSSPERINRELATETDRVMLQVLNDSKNIPPVVPVDTGALQSSGRVDPAQIRGKGIISANLTYGGINGVDYAVFVHENVGANFKRPGSGAKFVEAHIRRRSDEIVRRLTAAIERGAKS